MMREPVTFVNCTCWVSPGSLVHAVAIEGGRVDAVGEAALGRGRRVDLQGRTVLPGLIDAHCHLTSSAARRLRVDLSSCASLEEVLEGLRTWRATHPDEAWIRGWGWDHHRWRPSRLPSREDLDRAVPDRPVWCSRRDGHSAVLNSVALELLGVSPGASPDLLPVDAEGTPTGIVRETLMDDLASRLPPVSVSDHSRALREEARALYALGITGVHTVERARGIELLSLVGEELLLRTYIMAEGLAPDEVRQTPACRIGGFKLFVDGSLGSGTAWMRTDGGAVGVPVTTGCHLRERVEEALDHGLDPCVHAIGDLAVHEVAEVFRPLMRRYPSRVFRIEHAQHVDEADIPLLVGDNLFLSVQPCHLLNDRHLVDALPRRPTRRDFAFFTLASAGARLLLGTDFPIEPSDPWRNMAAALQRCAEGEEPWRPHERLGWDAVLAGYTASPAVAARWHDVGTLRPGASADLIVVEEDPSRAPPWHQRVCLTIVAGRVVHTDGSIDLP